MYWRRERRSNHVECPSENKELGSRVSVGSPTISHPRKTAETGPVRRRVFDCTRKLSLASQPPNCAGRASRRPRELDPQDHRARRLQFPGRAGEALMAIARAQAGSSRPPPRQVSRGLRHSYAISVLGARRDTVRRARPRDSVSRCALCNVVAPAQPNPPSDIVAERSR